MWEEWLGASAKTETWAFRTFSKAPPDDVLHVVGVIWNPCNYASRVRLALDFVRRTEATPGVLLYIVELLYDSQEPSVATTGHPRHLILRAKNGLAWWSKENLINLGVERLLPETWRFFAWIDMDIIFENNEWPLDTLRILDHKDVVQLFAVAADTDAEGKITRCLPSMSFARSIRGARRPYVHGHSGYAWAMTRRAYEDCGGLYEKGVLGSGDFLMACLLERRGVAPFGYTFSSEGERRCLLDWGKRAQRAVLGHVPGVVRHCFHGSICNRRYLERRAILVRHRFDPDSHSERRADGLLVPTESCPADMLKEIETYFYRRDEDGNHNLSSSVNIAPARSNASIEAQHFESQSDPFGMSGTLLRSTTRSSSTCVPASTPSVRLARVLSPR